MVTFWHIVLTAISFLNCGAALISAYFTAERLHDKQRKVDGRTMDRMRRSYTGSILDDELD